MWRGLRDWKNLSNDWLKMKFEDIVVDDIKSISDKYGKIVSKCSKKLPHNPILEELKGLLKVFKDAMPVVVALSNKVVQEDPIYWSEIQKIVGRTFVIDS